MFDLTGKTLGVYQIQEEIGRGGMGVVYKALHTGLNKVVALKVLPPVLGMDAGLKERFFREARLAAGLEHPNIVTIHDVSQQDGYSYIAMRFLEGETLHDLIERSGALPIDRVVSILRQVAAALDYAHSKGIVHRDVKPSNIIVSSSGQATLTDFGIARAATGERLTRTGVLIGTPEYMSPEQAEGNEIDSRTDLYSLGVVLYEMLSGRVPFSGTTPHSILLAHMTRQPQPPSAVNRKLSAAVDTVVLKALAKSPAARYQTGRAMVADFEAALRGGQGPRQAARPVVPMGLVAAAAALGLVLVLAWAALAFSGDRSRPSVVAATATPAPTPVTAATDTPVVATATAVPPTATLRATTATPCPTPIPAPQPTRPPVPASTPISAGLGAPTLSEPAAGATVTGRTTFSWAWKEAVGQNRAFELRIWKADQNDHNGATGPVTSLSVDIDVQGTPAVRQGGPGTYYWTVAVVQLSPYLRIGPEAAPWELKVGGTDDGGGGPPPPPPPPPPLPYPIVR